MSVLLYLRAQLRQCAIPVVGLCFGYWLMIDRPLSKNLAELSTKHRETITATANGIQDANKTRLELTTNLQLQQTLEEELKALQQHGVRLVAQRVDKQAELLSESSSASAMSSMFELFQAHHLECLESKLVAESKNPSADAPVFLKSIAELLGDGSKEKIKQREIRVTLRGRFEDIRSALSEMQVALACVYVVSLDMEPEIDGLHIWKLVLLV